MGFLNKIKKYFSPPKIRTGYEILSGRSLVLKLGISFPNGTQGFAWSGGFVNRLYSNPKNRKILEKYVPNIEEIIKSGHGLSLYTYGEPVVIGPLTISDLSFKQRRITHRHETFHRAVAKRAAEVSEVLGSERRVEKHLYNLVGKKTSSDVLSSKGADIIRSIYGDFSFNEYFARYAASAPAKGYKHSPTYYEAIKKIKLDAVISDWFDATGQRLSYIKMKKYLGEPTGAAAWLANRTVGKSGKPYNKIIGHHPGWANKQTERAIESDFTAGMSYTGSMSNMSKFGKKGLIAVTLAGSLMFGGTALADNVVPVGSDISIIERTERLRKLTDRMAGLTETTLEKQMNVSNQLFETAIHESGDLKYSRQMVVKDKKLVPRGRARSIFMIEPETAKNLVDWSKTRPKAMNLLVSESGKTAEELLGMSKNQLASLLMEHDHFAAAMARVKYLSVPGEIPGTLEARSKYWADYYMAGQKRDAKARQYVTGNQRVAEQVTAARTAEIIKRNSAVAPKQTAGLVNRVLQGSKTSSKMGTVSYKSTKFIKGLIGKLVAR